MTISDFRISDDDDEQKLRDAKKNETTSSCS